MGHRALENIMLIIGLSLLWISHSWADQSSEPINPYDAESGTLFFKLNGQYRASTALNTDVDIEVNGFLVAAKVKQNFLNDTGVWQEAKYVFPLPENSSVHAMRIITGERVIEGEIQEKKKARKTYEQAKSLGKRTALVEQQRPNMFTTEVAHIAPGGTVSVEIEYMQQLAIKDKQVELRFPTTITPRYHPQSMVVADRFIDVPDEKIEQVMNSNGWDLIEADPVPQGPVVLPSDVSENTFNLTLSVSPGFEIEGLQSMTHSLNSDFIDEAVNGGRYEARFAMTQEKMNRDFVVSWSPKSKDESQVALFTEQKEGELFGSLLVTPPEVKAEGILARELIFVVDTSGSMGGQPIEDAKNLLRSALGDLSPQDKFNIIRFSNSASAFWHRALDASPDNILRAQGFVNSLESGGGTEMSQALDIALKTDYSSDQFLRQVIFITDGSVGNEQALFRQIDKNLGHNRLFTVGIGAAPNSYFMRKAAEVGRGTFTYVDDQSQIQQKVKVMLEKIGAPLLRDIRLNLNGVDAEIYPPVIPDLYGGEPLSFSFRIKAEALPESLELSAQGANNRRWKKVLPLSSSDLQETSKGIDKLWARSKIDFLRNEHIRGVSREETEKYILDTALEYGVVSEVTSLVAVDKTPVREEGDVGLSKSDVPNLLPKGLTPAMTRYPRTFSGSLTQIWLGLMGLFSALGFSAIKRLARFHRGGRMVAMKRENES